MAADPITPDIARRQYYYTTGQSSHEWHKTGVYLVAERPELRSLLVAHYDDYKRAQSMAIVLNDARPFEHALLILGGATIK